MTTIQIAKVLAYVNSYHSLIGSDLEGKEFERAITYAERQCYKICGIHPDDLPAETEKMIEFLKKITLIKPPTQ